MDRLKEYKAKLVMYPRHANKPKKGEINDATKEQVQTAKTQNKTQTVLALPTLDKSLETVAITDNMKKFLAHSMLRRLRRDKFWQGKREKRAREAEEAKK